MTGPLATTLVKSRKLTGWPHNIEVLNRTEIINLWTVGVNDKNWSATVYTLLHTCASVSLQ